MENIACPHPYLIGSQQDQKPDNHLEWPCWINSSYTHKLPKLTTTKLANF